MRRALLLAAACLAAGCGGGPRPETGPVPSGAGAPTLLALGDSAMVAREPLRARALYERARAAAERDGDVVLLAQAFVGLGRFHTAARRYHDARVEFERAAAVDTTRAAPFYYLARAYLEVGEEAPAMRSLVAGLRREPGDARSLEVLRALTRSRCEAAGLPPELAEVSSRTSLSRGELGVLLAVMLGADPDRQGWSADRPGPPVPKEVDDAWGARWLGAAVRRGFLLPFPDGSLRLDDPVTRGFLALTISRLGRGLEDRAASPVGSVRRTFPDLGPRHYLGRAASRAVDLGLPTHEGGAFDPQAAATGLEILRLLDRLAAQSGASPLLPEELRAALVVQ